MPDAWAAAAAATAAVVPPLPLLLDDGDDDGDGEGEDDEEADAVDLTAGLGCDELLCECWACVVALLWARKATSQLARKGRFVGIVGGGECRGMCEYL